MGTAIAWLGVAPKQESVPADAGLRIALLYRLAIRRVLGDEPPGAQLRVLRTTAERSGRYAVACQYDPADPRAVEYLDWCRSAAPPTWAAAGMMTPAVGPRRALG